MTPFDAMAIGLILPAPSIPNARIFCEAVRSRCLPLFSPIACVSCFKSGLGLQIAAVHELETEPALDAQVAVRDLNIER